MNCSSSKHSQIPNSLIPHTNWFILSEATFDSICKQPSNFYNLDSLVLKRNSIKTVCESFIVYISKFNLEYVDLSENKLTRISDKIGEVKSLKTLLLANNPFTCNCDMLWMSDWLSNATNLSGNKIVKDYKNVTCHSGKMVGTPIYMLDSVKMECYPKSAIFETWKIVVIVSIGFAVIITVTVATIVIKRSREVRWLIYKNFNKLIKVEKETNIDFYEFDAFLSYRFEFYTSVSSLLYHSNILKNN